MYDTHGNLVPIYIAPYTHPSLYRAITAGAGAHSNFDIQRSAELTCTDDTTYTLTQGAYSFSIAPDPKFVTVYPEKDRELYDQIARAPSFFGGYPFDLNAAASLSTENGAFILEQNRDIFQVPESRQL